MKYDKTGINENSIIGFLDKNPGKHFSATELFERLDGSISLPNVHRHLKNISKYDGYEVVLKSKIITKQVEQRRMLATYGRKKEAKPNE
jgi:hypothetical protein